MLVDGVKVPNNGWKDLGSLVGLVSGSKTCVMLRWSCFVGLPSVLRLLSQANVLFTIAQNRKVSCKAYVMQNVLGLIDLLDQ